MAVNAYQQHAVYFTIRSKGKNAALGQSGFAVGTTDTTSAVLSNTANALVSYPFGYKNANSLPDNRCGGKKILVGVDITTAYDDVVAILSVSASHDGTSWADVATAIADTTPNVTGVKMALVDLSSIYAPYFRLTFNSSGLNCATAGKLKFFYGIPD